MITGSKDLIRDINSTNVLETIINSNSISRAAIAKKLGLSKATISNIVQDLIDKKLIKEIGSEDTDLGRKPILLSINQNAGYVISINLDINKITSLLSNLTGEYNQIVQVDTPQEEEQFFPVLVDLIDDLIKDARATPYGLIGIAIGIHGVTQNNQIAFAPYYSIYNLDLHQQLTNHYKTKVYLENEANLSVIGEKAFIYDYSNVANISIHSGVGLGLVINNNLYTGFSGHAGELGHTIVEMNGRECPCGNKGCLEQYVSEQALLKEYASKKSLSKFPFEEFCNMYRTGDEDALKIMDKFVHYMSICVNNVLNLYNPDIIIINSAFIYLDESLLIRIKHSLTSHMNSYDKIVPSALKNSSILLGGVCVCVKQFLGVNNLNLINIL
ncbi:MAG TPA: ROK family transcriptional regulator [Clostridiales bacterium]|nr:ROK family transcriptional regulator [Clostridiales bacterium]